jgi:hypothetical protein
VEETTTIYDYILNSMVQAMGIPPSFLDSPATECKYTPSGVLYWMEYKYPAGKLAFRKLKVLDFGLSNSTSPALASN